MLFDSKLSVFNLWYLILILASNPDNSFLGFAVLTETLTNTTVMEKENVGIIYGKDTRYLQVYFCKLFTYLWASDSKYTWVSYVIKTWQLKGIHM